MVNKFKKDGKKARSHIVLSVGKEPATLITSLILSGASTKAVWEKSTRIYQKEKDQFKLNLRTEFRNLRFKKDSDLQTHLTELDEMLLVLTRWGDPVTDKDKLELLLRSFPESFGSIARTNNAMILTLIQLVLF